jgi:hypothetical protein
MSGLGRKVWNPLDLLAAADVNGYLMDQTVMVFADATERLAAIPTPTEGMHTYRTNDNVVEVYNGSAWVSANSVGGTISINASNVTNTLTSSTATAYTFASGDQSTTIRFTSGSAVTATIGTATAFTAGQRVDLLQDGAGTVTVVPGSGVTLAGRGTAGTAYALTQFDGATIFCVEPNTYRIIGNVSVV